jgi:cytochrome c-type biogenesis protein
VLGQILTGPVVVTSLLAGVVALLAPCCVSVMLPAYLSTVFRRPAAVIIGTLVFAAGVATVIVPIGLGASALSAVFQHWHTPIFATGGLLMIAGGVAVLLGWAPKLPMPGGKATTGGGLGAAYSLGVFSGIASACCAPVLIGVTILAGATGSFPAALTVSLAYVTGMVAPLLVMALGFDRFGNRVARAMQGRRVPVWPGSPRRIPLGGLLSGLLLMLIGGLTVVLAITGPDMPTDGWRLRFAADLQHWSALVGQRLGWLPGWATLAAAAVAVLVIGWRIRRTSRPQPDPAEPADEQPALVAVTTQEGHPDA